MKSLKETLMQRDNMTAEEAEKAIQDARENMLDYLAEGDLNSAMDIYLDEFGLEPDYIMDLI